MPIKAAVGYSGAASGEAGSDASRWERTAAGVPGRAAASAEVWGQEGFLVTAERFGGGQARGKSGAGGGALRAGLPPARLRAGACPRAQVGTAQPPRGAAPRPRETARPFPPRTQGGSPRRGPWWGGAGRDPLRRPPRRRGLSGAGGSGVRRTGFPLPRVTAQHRAPKPPTAAEKGAGPAAPTRGVSGTAPAPGRAGCGWDPGGGMFRRLLAESCSPSGRERSSRRGAGPAPPSPGREEASPGKPLSQVPRGRTRPSRWAHRLPGAIGRTTSRAGSGGRGRRRPPHPRRILLRPGGKRTELGVRLAVGTAPELRLGRRDPPGPPAPLLNRGDGGREKRRAWRSPQPCCFLFHA